MTEQATPADATTGLSSSLPDGLSDRLEAVLRLLDDRDLSLALAESCTGGLVSAAFAGVEGLSHVLACGFVTYSDDAKNRVLGVPQSVLDTAGAVSREAAIAMAEGALERSSAQVAASVTGFAGPGGEGDEEGQVHFALAREGAETVHRERHFGAIGRDAVRLACLETMLDMLEAEGAR